MENNFKQNKINAIKKSIEMWEYIKNNRCCDKLDYFTENSIEEVPLYNCYLCESIDCCADCINWNVANKYYRVSCGNENSPYYSYILGHNYAYEIAPDMLEILKRELKFLIGDVENE